MQLFLESYFAFSGWSELEGWAAIREVGSHQTHPDPFGPTDEKFVVWLPGLIATGAVGQNSVVMYDMAKVCLCSQSLESFSRVMI